MTPRAARKHSIADIRFAIQEVGTAATALAKRLSVSRGTAYKYLRLPELAAVVDHAPVARTLKSREAVEAAIRGSRGIKQRVAEALGVTRQTVDNYLATWPELAGVFEDERDALIDRAESKLVEAVDGGEMRAILFILETLGKSRGWARRTEITGADGGALMVSPEVAAIIRGLGLDMSALAREFESMIRAEALARASDNAGSGA